MSTFGKARTSSSRVEGRHGTAYTLVRRLVIYQKEFVLKGTIYALEFVLVRLATQVVETATHEAHGNVRERY